MPATLQTAALRSTLEAALGSRFEAAPLPARECASSGVAGVDALAGGLPRGSVIEITGPASSGRTTLMLAALAAATARQEYCAVVDAGDVFDPRCAAAAGADLSRLLWVRCGGNAEHALKAADLLVHGGGFGLVVMDLGDIPQQTARRISLASWYRLRRAVEHTPTILMTIEREANAQSCAALAVRMERERIRWSGAAGCSRLLRGLRCLAEFRKPLRASRAALEALCLPASM